MALGGRAQDPILGRRSRRRRLTLIGLLGLVIVVGTAFGWYLTLPTEDQARSAEASLQSAAATSLRPAERDSAAVGVRGISTIPVGAAQTPQVEEVADLESFDPAAAPDAPTAPAADADSAEPADDSERAVAEHLAAVESLEADLVELDHAEHDAEDPDLSRWLDEESDRLTEELAEELVDLMTTLDPSTPPAGPTP